MKAQKKVKNHVHTQTLLTSECLNPCILEKLKAAEAETAVIMKKLTAVNSTVIAVTDKITEKLLNLIDHLLQVNRINADLIKDCETAEQDSEN